MSIDEARSSIAWPSAPAAAITDPRPATDHALRLPGGDWNVWRHFVLRGAGFPVSLVLGLSSDAASMAVDRFVDASRDVKRCQNAALRTVSRAFDGTDPAARQRLWARPHRIRKGTVNEGEGSAQEDALAQTLTVERSAHATYLDAFHAAAAATDEEIRRIALDSRFREATLWQNHRSVRLVEESLFITMTNNNNVFNNV